jgi:hypothetical protein
VGAREAILREEGRPHPAVRSGPMPDSEEMIGMRKRRTVVRPPKLDATPAPLAGDMVCTWCTEPALVLAAGKPLPSTSPRPTGGASTWTTILWTRHRP